jgi:hypothetical protein
MWYMDITEGSKSMLGYTEQPKLALESSLMSMYPSGHLSLAKEPSVLIIGPKKPVMAKSLSLFPMMSLSVMSQYHVPHIHPGLLREVLVLLCAPDGVPEHLKDVHLQFLDLTKTGKNIHFGSFFMT